MVATRRASVRTGTTPIWPSCRTCTSCSCSSTSSGRLARSLQPELAHLTENAAPHGSWRLFVAAPVPELAAARVFEVLADVRTRHPMVKWVPINKLHLTLVFLGQTDSGRVSEIAGTVSRVAAQHAPFEVATGDGGGKLDDRRG